MTNSKQPEQDIIAVDIDAPEAIADDRLDDVDGGYLKITMTNVQNTKLGGVNDATISGSMSDTTIYGSVSDDLVGNTTDSVRTLRKRPGR